mmetsp:Transcript_5000/g.6212  ORF Transcript_5000/g.6212 Transcript_5000/m.6212 type:complete len:291 (+) Transcript_5000:65-937(+)
MFEVCLEEGELFKKIVQAISDLVTEGNFQVDSEHISFQGMDSSHVSLVSLTLYKDGFKLYRCDRNIILGINFNSLNKILKCMDNNSKLMLKAQDDGDIIYIYFENNESNIISNFELKLMEIDNEQLGIPETNYNINIKLSSVLFNKIIKDLSLLGDSVTISVSKLGVKFIVNADIGNGEIHLNGSIKKLKSENDDDTDMKESNDNDGDNDDDIDAIDDDIIDGDKVLITMNDDASQTFSIKYLVNFCKATNLSKTVLLSMDNQVPLMITYKINDLGNIRYYLAPKIDDDE